jgi:hypothetical protein
MNHIPYNTIFFIETLHLKAPLNQALFLCKGNRHG